MLSQSASGGLNASGSQGKFTITAKEPSHAEVFYGTSNGQYKGHWHDGVNGNQVGNVPPISQILAARPTVRKPVRPLQISAKTILADQIAAEKKSQQAEKVISADVMPKKFPVQAGNFAYPPQVKHGHDNPLYSVSSQVYGNKAPMAHQVADRYFPSTNQFTKGFVDLKPRYTGLSTGPCLSKVHSALDEYY